MKNIVLIFVILLTLAGCQKPAEINGSWKGTDARLIPADSAKVDTVAWNENVRVHKATTFIFNQDSTFTGIVEMNGRIEENKATWKLTDDRKNLILKFSPEFSSTAAIDSLTGKRLVLRHSYPFGMIVMGFDKVPK